MAEVETFAQVGTTYANCWPCPQCGWVRPAGPCDETCVEMKIAIGYCDDCEEWFHVEESAGRVFSWPSP